MYLTAFIEGMIWSALWIIYVYSAHMSIAIAGVDYLILRFLIWR